MEQSFFFCLKLLLLCLLQGCEAQRSWSDCFENWFFSSSPLCTPSMLTMPPVPPPCTSIAKEFLEINRAVDENQNTLPQTVRRWWIRINSLEKARAVSSISPRGKVQVLYVNFFTLSGCGSFCFCFLHFLHIRCYVPMWRGPWAGYSVSWSVYGRYFVLSTPLISVTMIKYVQISLLERTPALTACTHCRYCEQTSKVDCGVFQSSSWLWLPREELWRDRRLG